MTNADASNGQQMSDWTDFVQSRQHPTQQQAVPRPDSRQPQAKQPPSSPQNTTTA